MRKMTMPSGEVVDLDEIVTLRDGTKVTFGEMTMEQHEDQIKWLVEQQASAAAEITGNSSRQVIMPETPAARTLRLQQEAQQRNTRRREANGAQS